MSVEDVSLPNLSREFPLDANQIYHDQALLKESGGGITPRHQDQHYWPLDTADAVTMWMPLVDVTPE
jgi:ectoine hydroxylase-related dioxygenase (phytanoyl-CoA dioxygenase family)